MLCETPSVFYKVKIEQDLDPEEYQVQIQAELKRFRDFLCMSSGGNNLLIGSKVKELESLSDSVKELLDRKRGREPEPEPVPSVVIAAPRSGRLPKRVKPDLKIKVIKEEYKDYDV